jgi:hypothetical protein
MPSRRSLTISNAHIRPPFIIIIQDSRMKREWVEIYHPVIEALYTDIYLQPPHLVDLEIITYPAYFSNYTRVYRTRAAEDFFNIKDRDWLKRKKIGICVLSLPIS